MLSLSGIFLKALVVFAFAALLLAGLFIYSKLSKGREPVMRENCHGDCSHCSSACGENKKP